MAWTYTTTGSTTDTPQVHPHIYRIGLDPQVGIVEERISDTQRIAEFNYSFTRKKEENMGALITISIRNIQEFDPVAVDLDSARFALAELHSLKAGYASAGLDVPDWLARKIKTTKRSLIDRERDADAAELARLEAQLEGLKSREEKLSDVQAKIDALRSRMPEGE